MDSTERVSLPAEKAVSFGLPLEAVTENPAGALVVLEQAVEGLRVAAVANVYYRFLMGAQLVTVRDTGLWRRRDFSTNGEAGSWNDWISNHFPVMFGLSRRTAYGAIQLAECQALRALGEDRMREFENLANAHALARIERQRGEDVSKGLAEAAASMSMDEFAATAGVPRGLGQTSTVTDTPAKADLLNAINKKLKDASEGSLESLRLMLDTEVSAVAGDNPEDIAGFILAALQHELEQHRQKGF